MFVFFSVACMKWRRIICEKGQSWHERAAVFQFVAGRMNICLEAYPQKKSGARDKTLSLHVWSCMCVPVCGGT